MGVLADLDRLLTRTFNPGSLAVDESARTFGVPLDDFTPQEYGSYVASSTAVYVCVKKRATYLASLPLVLSRLKADSTTDPVTKGALYELMRKVNPFWTARRLIEMTEMSLSLWGSAYWFLERGGSATGVPTQIYWARPDRVTVVPHPTEYVARFDYRPVNGAQPIPYKPSEVIWLRYPNPLEEYAGLSPLVAARLAADTQSAAMKQNRQLFVNGISLGGLVTPNGDKPMSQQAGKEITDQLKERAKGTANAHRWLVLLHDAKFQPMTMSPRDAEFIGLHKLTTEDIARSYGVPLDLIGGQRTYENYAAAVKAMWTETVLPEAGFIADELTEQLLPMFTGAGDRADVCHFDDSGIEVLQSDHKLEWDIASGQLDKGVITINEWRKDQKLDPLPWGEEVWWANLSLVPITTSEVQEPEPVTTPADTSTPDAQAPDAATAPPANDTGATAPRGLQRVTVPDQQRIAYDSEGHRRLWRAFVQRTERHEAVVASTTRRLFRQQEQSILTELSKLDDSRSIRAAEPNDIDSFMGKILNLARWRKRFRETIRPVLGKVVADGGQAAIDEVSLGGAFDVSDPLAARFLERRAQRFAVEINDTTWSQLKASLGEGLDAGEGTDVLAKRVRAVMGDRIRSSAETIARTEVISSYTGGYLEGAKQSGQVAGLQWMAALDDRTRSSHVDAHGQVVALGEDFEVGGSHGPGPGLIEAAEESINCFPGDTEVYAEGIFGATMRWYSGDLVRITLGDGRLVSVTPNHPLATPSGWIAAGKLTESDNLIGYRFAEDALASSADPHPHHGPAKIAEIFRLCAMAGHTKRIAGAHPQFHGDGMDGQVDVVWTSGELRRDIEPALEQPSAQHVLSGTEVDHTRLLGNSAKGEFVQRTRLLAHSSVSGGGESCAFSDTGFAHPNNHSLAPVAGGNSCVEQVLADGRAADAKPQSNLFFGHPGLIEGPKFNGINGDAPPRVPKSLAALSAPIGVLGGHDEPANLGNGAGGNAELIQDVLHRVVPHVEFTHQLMFRRAGEVTLNQIVRIEVNDFSGHVYNLQTQHGYYSAAGIVAHNCRCALLSVLTPLEG